MKRKLSTLNILLLSLLSGAVFPVSALAVSDYPTCAPSTLCTVGEFLYDDEYAPIATADCRLTAREPDGDLFINSATMSAQTDGWYSINVSTASAVGVYRSQVCCTSGTDYLCLDKTFEIVATPSALTAANVWDYSTRTLSSYGTLIADIWSYSSRSLSSFGTLVSDIWSNTTRTITGGGDTNNTTNNYSGSATVTNSGTITNNTTNTTTSKITDKQVKDLLALNAENRKLLERIVNKPIVKTFIDEGAERPSLESKIDRTKNVVARLYAGAAKIKSHVQLLSLQWPILSTLDIQNGLTTLAQTITEDNDKKDSSVLTLSRWLKDAWGNGLALEVSDQVETINSKIDSLKRNLEVSGKAGISAYPNPLDSILAHTNRLTDIIGNIDTTTTNKDQGLYGFLRHTSGLSDSYNKEVEAIGQALMKWDTYSESEQAQTVSRLTKEVLAINQIGSGERLLENKTKNTKNALKNKLFSLLALIDTNKIYLTSNVGQTIQNIWLEEGSIIFRAVATNPSKTISQKVPLKYYLPTEVKKEHVISADSELTINYDANEDALFASADISLAPEEIKTYTVEIEDIWTYSEEEIDAYKKQVQTLIAPLKNTAYFAQSASLQSDINVILDKIMARQKQATTPEFRIRTHRESALEMVGVEEKILALKQLVNQASSGGSIFGFAGGIQSVAAWGLIIILISGFVFLISYMRVMHLEQAHLAYSITQPKIGKPEAPRGPQQTTRQALKKTAISRARQLTRTIIIVLLTGSFSILGSSLIVASVKKNNTASLITPVNSGLILGRQAPTSQK